MGEFFEKTFLPSLKTLVKADLSYDELKTLVRIPSTWGAKLSGEPFQERVARGWDERQARGKPRNTE